jgi:hypothetical protein
MCKKAACSKEWGCLLLFYEIIQKIHKRKLFDDDHKEATFGMWLLCGPFIFIIETVCNLLNSSNKKVV